MCPTFQALAPIWRINEHIYGASSLPSPFYPAYDNLLIPTVLLAMDKFIFQCFIPTGVRYGVVPSSVGTLTVDARNSIQERSTVENSEVNFNLDHWRLHFYQENMTLSWKYSYNNSFQSSKLCSFSDAKFHIEGWQCLNSVRNTLVWQAIRRNTTEISIPFTNLTHNNNSVFINMTVTSVMDPNMVCASLNYQFKVGRGGKCKINLKPILNCVIISLYHYSTNQNSTCSYRREYMLPHSTNHDNCNMA